MLRKENNVKADPFKAYGWLHNTRELGHAKADEQLGLPDFNLTPNKSIQARAWVQDQIRTGLKSSSQADLTP